MALLNLDLPRIGSLDTLIQVLNDRLRAIADAIASPVVTADEDMAGYRITNLGDGSAPMDALNLRTGDRRYATQAAITQIQQSVATAQATGSTGHASGSTASHGTLILTVPGVLAIQSQAAALVQLSSDTVFTSAVALLKQAPVGAALTLNVSAGGNVLGSATVGDGKTTASVDASGWKAAAKNTTITVDLTAVGLTFPGADLTLELQF